MLIKSIFIWLLSLFDWGATQYQVNRFGIEIEANPIMRWLYSSPYISFIVKMAITSIGCLILWYAKDYKIARIGSWLLLVVYSALAIYHIILLLLRWLLRQMQHQVYKPQQNNEKEE